MDLTTWLDRQTGTALLIVGAALAVALVALVWTNVRLGRLNRLYRRLTRGTSGGNIEEVLNEHLASVESFSGRVSALERHLGQTNETLRTCVQRVGVVRFDAFEDVGGQQSFALVMLDGANSGVAVSSIYSRTEVRIYAKPITNGQAVTALTTEEEGALAAALGRSKP